MQLPLQAPVQWRHRVRLACGTPLSVLLGSRSLAPTPCGAVLGPQELVRLPSGHRSGPPPSLNLTGNSSSLATASPYQRLQHRVACNCGGLLHKGGAAHGGPAGIRYGSALWVAVGVFHVGWFAVAGEVWYRYLTKAGQ